jgi:hypothetical protein
VTAGTNGHAEQLSTPQSSYDSDRLTRIEQKLDTVLAFQVRLEPYLPLLAKASSFLHNPAMAWRRNRG